MTIGQNKEHANGDSLVETLLREGDAPPFTLKDGLVVKYRNGLPVICRTGEPFVVEPTAIRLEKEGQGL